MSTERFVRLGRNIGDGEVICYFESTDCEHEYMRILPEEQATRIASMVDIGSLLDLERL